MENVWGWKRRTARALRPIAERLGVGRFVAPESVFDRRRFRPNLLIESPAGTEGLPERQWVGKRLRIGGAVLSVGMEWRLGARPASRIRPDRRESGPGGVATRGDLAQSPKITEEIGRRPAQSDDSGCGRPSRTAGRSRAYPH